MLCKSLIIILRRRSFWNPFWKRLHYCFKKINQKAQNMSAITTCLEHFDAISPWIHYIYYFWRWGGGSQLELKRKPKIKALGPEQKHCLFITLPQTITWTQNYLKQTVKKKSDSSIILALNTNVKKEWTENEMGVKPQLWGTPVLTVKWVEFFFLMVTESLYIL